MGEAKELTYLNFKDWTPYFDKPLILKTKYGEMSAIWRYGALVLTRTDCTHPLQNCYISIYDVYEWRYENEQDMNDLLFIKNTWQREMEGEEIIKSMSKPKVKSPDDWFTRYMIILWVVVISTIIVLEII